MWLFVFIPGGFFCFALIISIYSAKGWKKLADIHGIDSLNAGLGYCHDRFHAAIPLKKGCTLTPEKNPVCGNFRFSQNSMSLFSGLAELMVQFVVCLSRVVWQVRDR